MSRSRILILFFSITTVFFLLAGSTAQPPPGAGASTDDISNNTSIYLPLIQNDLPPIIPDTTEVLTEATTQHLSSVSGDGSIFAFAQSTPELAELDAGDLMVGGVSTAAPYGFLRRVTGVTTPGGQVVVTTENATLEDAIKQVSVSHSRRLSPNDIDTSAMVEGVSLMRPAAAQGDQFVYNLLDVVLHDLDGDLGTTGDQVTANGSITLETSYDFALTIEDWELESLSFIRNDTETAELIVEADVEKKVTAVKQIARHVFTPITIYIPLPPPLPPLPVVFVPVLEVNVGVDGNLHANITTSVTQQATLQTGLTYDNGAWNPISDLTNKFSHVPPTLTSTLDVRGYTEAQIKLMLYGVVGPYAEVEPYLLLEADINANPWWTLYGGLDVPIGVKIDVLGNSIADYETIPIAYREVLAQASTNEPPNVPANPSPLDGAVDQSVDADLTWSGGDPDGNTVTYDVFLEVGDTMPDTLLCDDVASTSCNPGTLSYATQYYWQVVATDEHGATRAGPVWDFVTATNTTVGPLVYDSHAIWDEDGIVSCGDNPEMPVTLRNLGSGTATNVAATISENDSYVTLTNNTSDDFPDIPGGQTASQIGDFSFLVASNTPDGHTIQFNLNITASNGGPWSDSFSVPVSCNAIEYFDDFSNPASGWPTTDNSFYALGYDAGNYRIQIKQLETLAWAFAPGIRCNNCTIQFDAWSDSGDSSRYGIVFGVSDDLQSFYLFDVAPFTQTYALWRYNSGSGYTSLIPWTDALQINANMAQNRLKVVRQGPQIEVYVNGSYLNGVNDSTYMGELQIGVVAQSWTDFPVWVRYDNFSAWGTGTVTATTLGASMPGLRAAPFPPQEGWFEQK